MSKVFKADSLIDKKEYAVKMINKDFLEESDYRIVRKKGLKVL
jgi:hypothetical protein